MTIPGETIVQHLIDPELCIRCNTCEETCPIGAISNDFRNYVVDADVCNACGACVKPCPTGAINVWRRVSAQTPYTLAEQFSWDGLPDSPPADDGVGDAPGERGRIAVAVENLYTQKQPATAVVRENTRVTAAGAEVEIHHIVLDLSAQDFPFVEGQSIGVIPPGRDGQGKPYMMRLYSVACPREGEGGTPGHLALTVKRVVKDHMGQGVLGVCSNHLCDRRTGDTVSVAGPFGVDFLMPDDDRAPLLMVCTGTGVAPMRAMIQRRRMRAAGGGGAQMLFYGGRTPDETAYCDELRQYGDAVGLNFAFSRQPGEPKRYVQDVVREAHAQVAALLADNRTHLYLCGLKGMENGVFDALRDVCARHGFDWITVRTRMQGESRLHVETY